MLSVFSVCSRGERNFDRVSTALSELKVLKVYLILDWLPGSDCRFLIEQVPPLRALVHRLILLLCLISIVGISPLLRCLLNRGIHLGGSRVLPSTFSLELGLDVHLNWGYLGRQVLAQKHVL